MRKYIVLIITLVLCGIVFAHNQTYQGKSYTFHRADHVIDVELDHGNTLKVSMDTVEIGTRTNFCTPID
jgi:hypothetical protein